MISRSITLVVTASAAVLLPVGPAQAAYVWPSTTICQPTTVAYDDAGLTTPVTTLAPGTWVDVLQRTSVAAEVSADDATRSYWVESRCLRVVKH